MELHQLADEALHFGKIYYERSVKQKSYVITLQRKSKEDTSPFWKIRGLPLFSPYWESQEYFPLKILGFKSSIKQKEWHSNLVIEK